MVSGESFPRKVSEEEGEVPAAGSETHRAEIWPNPTAEDMRFTEPAMSESAQAAMEAGLGPKVGLKLSTSGLAASMASERARRNQLR
jgi:hypothetical protein